MLTIEWAKFILKALRKLVITVEAMACEAIRTIFHGNELY